MGPHNRYEIAAIAIQQSFPGRDGIQEIADRHHPKLPAEWKVFGEHDLVIPEVQVGLFRISPWERTAPHMIHAGPGTGKDPVSCELYAPAEIDLLLVCEKVFIKTTHLVEHRSANK